jgi:hypothetical protein
MESMWADNYQDKKRQHPPGAAFLKLRLPEVPLFSLSRPRIFEGWKLDGKRCTRIREAIKLYLFKTTSNAKNMQRLA